jgi:hypothetical protein
LVAAVFFTGAIFFGAAALDSAATILDFFAIGFSSTSSVAFRFDVLAETGLDSGVFFGDFAVAFALGAAEVAFFGGMMLKGGTL